MNGYKTGGDWTDVTSIGRNEVVFEGRHKAYGAFYIRKRYPNALLVSLLSAIAFVGLCSFGAYVFRGIAQHVAASGPVVIVTPLDPTVKPRIIIPPPTHPPVQPPKTTTPHVTPPVIASQPIIDTAPPIHSEHTSVTPPGNGAPGNDTRVNPLPNDNPLPEPEDNKIRLWVNEMPKFRGGKIEDYLAKQLQYPAEEAQLGMQGIAYVSFVIEKDGSVSNVVLERGISNAPDLNKEALRVISEMPAWIPGKQDGHLVRIQFVVPIRFKVQ